MTSNNKNEFRLMGLEASPYTMKVDAYLTFKGLPFKWISRNMKTEGLFQKHAKVQLIPLLFFPDGETMQDSTPILERLESDHPEPTIHPEDPTLWFLSCLLEEFGDEWCNKLMFFQRWLYKADQEATAKRLAGLTLEGQWYALLARPFFARMIIRRMVPRMSFAGATPTNIPIYKESFFNLSKLLDQHLATRPYLLGARPSFGDFGMWCNLYQAWTDPTPRAHFEAHTPHLLAWIHRMRAPRIDGDFESLDTLLPTLKPILTEEVGARFLPWVDANERAWVAGAPETAFIMNGAPYRQKTFKYQAFTLEALRSKFRTVSDNPTLRGLLRETGCLDVLAVTETTSA
ncbi:MAG: glutathione S-transferase family protein [Rhizobiales bacterium]|nr:glutathione S-transferase family protein [Hyphomicrobiales bacterium]